MNTRVKVNVHLNRCVRNGHDIVINNWFQGPSWCVQSKWTHRHAIVWIQTNSKWWPRDQVLFLGMGQIDHVSEAGVKIYIILCMARWDHYFYMNIDNMQYHVILLITSFLQSLRAMFSNQSNTVHASFHRADATSWLPLNSKTHW